MSFDPAGGAISGADDVALSNPQTDEVLTYNASTEKWQNQEASGGVSSSNLNVTAAISSVTVTQDDVIVTGQSASSAQTVELQHVTADGDTTTLMATVTVPAGSDDSIDPPNFSQAFARGDRFAAVRTSGTGAAPVVSVIAA